MSDICRAHQKDLQRISSAFSLKTVNYFLLRVKVDRPYTVIVCRMPTDRCGAIIKYSSLFHQHFSGTAFLGRASIKTDGSFYSVFL